ncbi:unnamed protein product [Ectocarpus sp. 4 AP-2014]|uniref:EsV-1-198 n=1 Tax=Ectocarpus siliculosus virus 1 (isolate New Zealand/Kaikoura/1988) TaxID=654926 RepID=Q8QN91_ESV1K|nr:EsV-1-198 [Ectocarpus siliculosus virus 1]AAK14612.1 EsV-1-198 [Ectocarpus siliculosus virus 1]
MTTGVSDEELLTTFRAIGEASISDLMLTYFQTELDDYSLNMKSRVFPVPTNSEVIFINQLAVRTCLLNNWSGIQDSYPCLHDFEYVVGDADFLYTMKYPYMDMTTLQAHAIETVHDFVDFVFEFIQSLCMPCIYQSDKSCVVMRLKMKEALENCRTRGGCSDARRNLLNFVTRNLTRSDPDSSMNMTANVNWNHHNAMAKTVVNYNKTLPTALATSVSIELNKHTPESPLYADCVKTLEILNSAENTEIQEATAMYCIQGVLKMNPDVIYQIAKDVETHDWKLVDVFHRGKKIIPLVEQVEDFNALINEVLLSILENKNLDVFEKLVRYQQKTTIPLDFSVKGSYDTSGAWHAKSMIYVVNSDMRMQTMREITDMHSRSANRTTMVIEKNVLRDTTYVDMARWVGQKDGGDPHEDMRKTDGLQEQTLDLTNDSEEAAIENSRVLSQALYGDADRGQGNENFIDQDEFVATIIFLDEETVQRHPEQLTGMMDVMTKHNYYRGELAQIKNQCELQWNLDQAKRFKEMTTEIESLPSCTDTEPDNIPALHAHPHLEKKLIKTVAAYIASFTPKKLDYRLARDVSGWTLFQSYRDAVKNAEKDGKEPSAEDRAKQAKAHRAYELAKLFRKRNSSPLWWWGNMMRKQHHGLMDQCIMYAPSACWNYMRMQLELRDGRDGELFELNFYKLVYAKLIGEVADENYADLKNFAEDIMFSMEYLTPRWDFPFFMRPSELEFFSEATGFLAFYAATWVGRGIGVSYYPLTVDDAGELKFPENILNRNDVFKGQQLVIATGVFGGVRLDLTLLHFLLFWGLQKGLFTIGKIYQSVARRYEQKPDAPENPAITSARERAKRTTKALRSLGNRSETRQGKKYR